ncbi:methyltransferase family protein [Limoniibacter endophyticus]|uniref:methyltransferase family protein n=1 Tax=Limoniibacter endophyticus TaxID=1565040 RepID=UPI0016779C5D
MNKAYYLDLFEKVSLSIIFFFMSYRFLDAFLTRGDVISLLLLITEAASLCFILFRRRSETISVNWRDWMLAYCGSFLPLTVRPEETVTFGAAIALAGFIGSCGILVQLWAKFTLRRSFGIVAANRGVKTHGPYRFVRHPMYAGYMVTQIAFLATHYTAYNVTIYVFLWALQIGRILAEERILFQDPAYQEMAIRVRHRLLPGIF